MKKILCIFLSMFLLLNIVNMDILRINSSAEDNTLEYAIVKVITNNIPEKIAEGAQIEVDIKTKKENKTKLIKKDNKIYMPLDDICEFTRTHKEKTDNKYILRQGQQEITAFIEDNGNSKLKSPYGDFNLKTLTEDNKVYCEPEPLMSMLFADCTYYDNTLLIDLPKYTVFEATSFDYHKYQSDILWYGIDKNTDNMGTQWLKWGLVIQRLWVSIPSDAIVDCNYGIFSTIFAEDNIMKQYYYEAFNEVLGYDIYSDKSVIEEETKIYETINNLGSFLEKTKDGDISDTPFTDFYISSYIRSYSKKDLKDNNSLSMFNDTIKTLRRNGEIDEKLNSYLNQSGKDGLNNILFNSALEYIKRSSYDRKVLKMFKTLYSEETVNKYDISLSEGSRFFFQCARDYYNSCNSFDEIVKEVTLNESINKFSEMIIKGLFYVSTAGKSKEIFETYETILTAEKLKEANGSFKPVEKINNSTKYFWLAKMQYMTVLNLDKIDKKAYESLNSEDMANFVSYLDFYNRISAVMIKTLADSYQLPTTTEREKDLIANSKDYIKDLCINIYNLEKCEYNLPTKEDLNNKNCDVFSNFFSKQPVEPTANYRWYLSPTIEAEDIIIIDNKNNFEKASAYDQCAIIKQNSKYGIIEYNGICTVDPTYEFGSFDLRNSAVVWNSHNNEYACVYYNIEGEINIEKNAKNPYPWSWGGLIRDTYLWVDNKVCPLLKESVSENYNDGHNVVVQSAQIGIDNQFTNISEKYGIANHHKLLVPIEYDKAYMHGLNDIIALKKNEKWSYFDKNGNIIIENCEGFKSNSTMIDSYYDTYWDGSNYSYNNYSLPYITNEKYILPYIPTENYIPVKIDGKCGYYDTKGNEIIPCGTFEEVRPVHNGLAWVKKDGKWGVIKLKDIETETNENENWRQLYADELKRYMASDEYNSDAMFDLYDINNDNIPELFISSGTMLSQTGSIYTVFNGKLVDIGILNRFNKYSPSQKVLYSYDLTSGNLIFNYRKLENDLLINLLSGHSNSEMNDYSLKGEKISVEKYNEEVSKYKADDYIEVGRKYKLDEATINLILLNIEAETNIDNNNSYVNIKDYEGMYYPINSDFNLQMEIKSQSKSLVDIKILFTNSTGTRVSHNIFSGSIDNNTLIFETDDGYAKNSFTLEFNKGKIYLTGKCIDCYSNFWGIPEMDNIEMQYKKAILLTGTVNTEKDPLNVRKSPSIEAEIIGRIDKGSTVTVYSETDGWCEIEYNGGIGYVSKDYISYYIQ